MRVFRLMCGITLLVFSPAAGQEIVAFTGATVIDPAAGAATANAVIVVQEGRIASIGSGIRVPAAARRVDLTGRYVMPGLIDAHVHLGDFAAARRALRSGVTTARSMGVSFYADVGMRDLQKQGRIESPEIVAAGYHVRPAPAEGFWMDHPELSGMMEVGIRGEAAMRAMAGALISRSIDVIKVNATERAGLPETDPRQAFYGQRELEALVSAGAEAGIPVAAHAHGDGGGRAAVLAGVRSIEHGTYLSEETLGYMRERGTYLVPTLAVVVDLTLPGGDYDSPVLQVRGRHMLPRVREMAANAHRLGVRVVAGTDTGYGPESTLRISHELIELVGIGMTPVEAIRAATTTAADLLGVQDHTGGLAAGMDADFIVMERNPLEDIGAVQDLLMVVSDGRVVVDRERR